MHEILVGVGGGDEAVIDVEHGALFAALVDGLLQLLLVGVARAHGVEFEFLAGLEVDEFGDAVDRKLQLHRVENLEQDDVVHLFAEVRERVENRVRVVEAIAEQHDEAAL